MMIVLTREDLASLSPAARAEVAALAFPKAQADREVPPGFHPDDFEDVVDLSPAEVETFMKGCAEETVAGLKVIAEHGPVIQARLLDAAGIDNYGHFQGRVTKRTRTVTGRRDVFLFTWDNWAESPDGVGRYAVSPRTHRALRSYFGLDGG